MTLDEVLRGDGDRPVVPGADRGDRRASSRRSTGARWPSLSARRAALPQAQGLLRPPPRASCSAPTSTRCARARHALGVRPVYKRVDTCAAEFATQTAYMYSTYDEECEAEPTDRKKIMVLGGGPNRIGQGIEFDYCCVHAALAMREDGYETIMVNCNPETVSTDYDTSRPAVLRAADARRRARDRRQGEAGRRDRAVRRPDAAEARARPRARTACRSSAPRPTSIDVAEDRERFQKLLHELGLKQPPNRTARTEEQALAAGAGDRLPAGRAAELRARRPRDGDRARRQGPRALHARGGQGQRRSRRCCSTASSTTRSRSTSTASATASDVVIGGIMEHIEQAGVHSGDSACSLPPYSLSPALQDELRRQTALMAQGAEGRRPDERAVRDPGRGRRRGGLRARSEPARVAHRALRLARRPASRWPRSPRAAWSGQTLADQQGVTRRGRCRRTSRSRKRCSRSSSSRRRHDPRAGDEVHRRGDGRGRTFGEAFLKSQLGAGSRLPTKGTVVHHA